MRRCNGCICKRCGNISCSKSYEDCNGYRSQKCINIMRNVCDGFMEESKMVYGLEYEDIRTILKTYENIASINGLNPDEIKFVKQLLKKLKWISYPPVLLTFPHIKQQIS